PVEVGAEPLEVLEPEALERLDLVGEVADAVADPVRDRRREEAAVPARRTLADRVALYEDDAAIGVARLRMEGCPEAREAAAADAEVGLGMAIESRVDDRIGAPVEPERARDRRGVGGAVGSCRR